MKSDLSFLGFFIAFIFGSSWGLLWGVLIKSTPDASTLTVNHVEINKDKQTYTVEDKQGVTFTFDCKNCDFDVGDTLQFSGN